MSEHVEQEQFPGSTSRAGRDPARRPGTATHAHHPKLQHHFDDMEQQVEASTLGMWVFLVTEIMFFGGLFMAYLVYRHAVAAGVPGSQPPPERRAGARSTPRVLIVSSLTMALGGARGADQPAARRRRSSGSSRRCSSASAFLGIKAIEYTEKFRDHIVPGPALPRGEGHLPEAGASCSTRSTSHDRPARAAHDHRARDHDRGSRSWPGSGRSTPSTTRRSKWPASTGTSSTSSGFSCSRCCTSSAGTITHG